MKHIVFVLDAFIDKFCSSSEKEERENLEPDLTNTRARIYARYAMGLLHQGKRKKARYFFRASFVLKPSIKIWFRYNLTYLPTCIAKFLDGSYLRIYKGKRKLKKMGI